jgi:dolichyl-phosphate-mannose-protein mannosyltransferase
LDEYEFLIAPLVFTALAFFTRMWKIGLSPIVTWDEAQYVAPPYTHLLGTQRHNC